MRALIVLVCTLLSAPGALLGLLGVFALAAEPCRVGVAAGACGLQHVAGWLMLPAFIVAWLAYVSMVACWVGQGREHRTTLKLGTGAALGYSVLAIVADGGSLWWTAVLVCTLPVLPAMLLATFLVWHFTRPEPAVLRLFASPADD